MSTDITQAMQMITQEYMYAMQEHKLRKEEGMPIIESTSDKNWQKKHGTKQIDITKVEFKDLPHDLKSTSVLAVRKLIEEGEIEDAHEEIDIDGIDVELESDIVSYLEAETQILMEKAFKNDSISSIKEAMVAYDVYDKFDKHCRDRIQKTREGEDSGLE